MCFLEQIKPKLTICPKWEIFLKIFSGFLYCVKVSKNITFASKQKTEQIYILSHTIMACDRQTEKVTYDLGYQGFSLLGAVGQSFPDGPMR